MSEKVQCCRREQSESLNQDVLSVTFESYCRGRQTDGWADRQTDGWADRRMGRQTNRRMGRQTDRWADRQADRDAGPLELKPFVVVSLKPSGIVISVSVLTAATA